jgi:transcription-repair coupling factor (superfamily II helicase)
LIVNPADNLGLTQLYQLRGRVGRGSNVAYAYFLFNSDRSLTGQARERLKTIAQTTQLGAGFAIAMKDLEIRGAGNLLGVEQSGSIASVGFSYYCQLLAEAVEEIKAKREQREVPRKAARPEAAIDLRIPAFIPEDYIGDTRTRFNFYQRLAKAHDMSAIREIGEELADRFGAIPAEVSNLLYVVELKHLAGAAGVESIFASADLLTISTGDATVAEKFSNVSKGRGIKVGNRQIKLDRGSIDGDWHERLMQLISELAFGQNDKTGAPLAQSSTPRS